MALVQRSADFLSVNASFFVLRDFISRIIEAIRGVLKVQCIQISRNEGQRCPAYADIIRAQCCSAS